MAKFKKGDRIRQVSTGWGTTHEDQGKEAIVDEAGADGSIKLNRIGNWVLEQEWVWEEGFELVEKERISGTIEVGDTVEVLKDRANNSYFRKGDKFVVTKINTIAPISSKQEENYYYGALPGHAANYVGGAHVRLIKKGGESMSVNINEVVAKVYEKTEDAILVSVEMGTEIKDKNFLDFLIVRNNKAEILKEAKRSAG